MAWNVAQLKNLLEAIFVELLRGERYPHLPRCFADAAKN